MWRTPPTEQKLGFEELVSITARLSHSEKALGAISRISSDIVTDIRREQPLNAFSDISIMVSPSGLCDGISAMVIDLSDTATRAQLLFP